MSLVTRSVKEIVDCMIKNGETDIKLSSSNFNSLIMELRHLYVYFGVPQPTYGGTEEGRYMKYNDVTITEYLE